MIVMPANATGWFWHCLARETQKIGHLYSPGAQRGPYGWMPYCLDNGVFALWNSEDNSFDEARWLTHGEPAWRRMLFWAEMQCQKPGWMIVPDRPGDRDETLRKWDAYAPSMASNRNPAALAIAVQNGMTPEDVRSLDPAPEVICVAGSTDWKWDTIEMWISEFPRVHLLRCNMPNKLRYLDDLGVESCDGTGWGRDRAKLRPLEEFCRGLINKTSHPLWPHACRGKRKGHQLEQESFI